MRKRSQQFVCPNCDEPIQIRLIEQVDADTDATGLSDLLSGRMNRLTCPVCGHSGLAPEPVLVRSESHKTCFAFLPFPIPANRKAHLAGRLKGAAQKVAGPFGTAGICFGVKQLREEAPWITAPATAGARFGRFDAPGSPYHRVHALHRAAKIRTGDTRLQVRLGMALYDLGNLSDAARTLTAVINEEKDNSDAWRCLGSVLLDSGRFREACDAFDRAYALGRDEVCLFLAGVAAFKAGWLPKALVRLQQAIARNNALVDAHIWMAVVHTAAGDHARAIDALRGAAFAGLKDSGLIRRRRELAPLEKERAFRSLIEQLDRPRERGQRKAGVLQRRADGSKNRAAGPPTRTTDKPKRSQTTRKPGTGRTSGNHAPRAKSARRTTPRRGPSR